jgi:hypothetical protein
MSYLVAHHVRWGPCYHNMACSQVADGGKASRYGGGGELLLYLISRCGQLTRGYLPLWGWAWANNPPPQKCNLL